MSKKYQGAIAFFAAILLIGVVLYLVFSRPDLNNDQRFFLRITMALAAAGFAAFIPGFLQIDLPIGVRAGGAIAVFAIVYLLDPPTRIQPDERPSHQGSLGALYDALNANVSSKEFALTLANERRNELRSFWVEPRVTDEDWAGVVAKICRTYDSCLACEPPADQISKSVKISIRNDGTFLEKFGLNNVTQYRCKS